MNKYLKSFLLIITAFIVSIFASFFVDYFDLKFFTKNAILLNAYIISFFSYFFAIIEAATIFFNIE